MTDILIGTHSRNSWQRPGTTATLRIWFSGEFRDTNGVMVTPGNGTSSFYDIINCTVDPLTHIVTIPPFTLPSTLDGLPAYIQSYGRLYDESGAPREFLWSGWSLSNLPTSLPFNAWFIFNQGSSLSDPPDFYLNRQEVIALIDSLLDGQLQGFLSEEPAGVINGVNPTFTLSNTPVAGSLLLFLNGNLQEEGNLGAGTSSYTISGATITHNGPPLTGDWLYAVYRTAGGLISGSIISTQIQETGGPTTLNIGAIADGQIFGRRGSTVVGVGRADLDATEYGVLGDALVAIDGAITSGLTAFTSASSSYPVSIVGKAIAVVGAGAAGATLVTTVLARPSPTSLTLATVASTTVTGARTVCGTDCAALLQNALNAALALGIRIVRMPRGLYFFPSGSIDIPQSITLQGSFDFRSIHRGGGCGLTDPEYDPIEGDATTFLITANEGTGTGYFMRLATNAAVKGVFTYYPAQIPSLATPKVYPFNFELRGTGSHLEDVEIGLAYQGVKVIGGIQQVVRNVAGQPLLVGLYATQILDSPIFEHIRFETFHLFSSTDPLNPAHTCPGAQALALWQLANGTAYKFGRVDNGQAIDLMCFGYQIGLHLVVDAPSGDGPGGVPWVAFTSGDMEAAKPMVVDNTASLAVGSASGCTFVNFAFGPNQTADNAVAIEATFTGRLSFTNCDFTGVITNGIHYKAGAIGWLGVVNCDFAQWTSAAIRLEGPGAVTIGLANLIGNRYRATTVPTIDISGRMSGVSSGNSFAATLLTGVSSSSTLPFQYGPDLFSDGAVANYAKALRVSTPVLAAESLWSTNYRLIGINTEGFQIAGGLSHITDGDHVLNGAYFDGTNWRYSLTSVPATNYSQSNGMHLFRVAPAGTSGNVVPWLSGLNISTLGISNFLKGADVASAGTIAPTGNTFRVTGTTTISTITATGIADGTVLNIVAVGALPFDELGNITINSAATTLTAVAGDLLIAVWDATATKWRLR